MSDTDVDPVRVYNPHSALRVKVQHHDAMPWRDVPAFCSNLTKRNAMAAKALMFTKLTDSRTSEDLEMNWPEVDFGERLWTIPADRMKGGKAHRYPLRDEILAILESLSAMKSE